MPLQASPAEWERCCIGRTWLERWRGECVKTVPLSENKEVGARGLTTEVIQC